MNMRLGIALMLVTCVLILPGALSAKSRHTITMNALNGSGQSGTATIKKSGSNLVITINLTGEPAGASEPAHIHPGSCANPNPVPKAVLSPVVDGKSVSTIPKPTTHTEGARSILVHKGGGADMKVYVACGDLMMK